MSRGVKVPHPTTITTPWGEIYKGVGKEINWGKREGGGKGKVKGEKRRVKGKVIKERGNRVES